MQFINARNVATREFGKCHSISPFLIQFSILSNFQSSVEVFPFQNSLRVWFRFHKKFNSNFRSYRPRWVNLITKIYFVVQATTTTTSFIYIFAAADDAVGRPIVGFTIFGKFFMNSELKIHNQDGYKALHFILKLIPVIW